METRERSEYVSLASSTCTFSRLVPLPSTFVRRSFTLAHARFARRYLNRNLAVVATLVVGDDSKLGREWVGSEPGSSKKPRGVDGQDQGAEEASMPSVYVTFVDTVSGRVLYRVGHSDASIIGSELGCVIVENAVYYTTFNTRTKRSEISSVTLWDGIVTPDQITMFKSFETEKTFSSVGSQGPIPLARTFVYPKTLTSLAVSVTRSGVSSKALLGTLVGGQVVSIDVSPPPPHTHTSGPERAVCSRCLRRTPGRGRLAENERLRPRYWLMKSECYGEALLLSVAAKERPAQNDRPRTTGSKL